MFSILATVVFCYLCFHSIIYLLINLFIYFFIISCRIKGAYDYYHHKPFCTTFRNSVRHHAATAPTGEISSAWFFSSTSPPPEGAGRDRQVGEQNICCPALADAARTQIKQVIISANQHEWLNLRGKQAAFAAAAANAEQSRTKKPPLLGC